jgi:hypothetical protein
LEQEGHSEVSTLQLHQAALLILQALLLRQEVVQVEMPTLGKLQLKRQQAARVVEDLL